MIRLETSAELNDELVMSGREADQPLESRGFFKSGRPFLKPPQRWRNLRNDDQLGGRLANPFLRETLDGMLSEAVIRSDRIGRRFGASLC